MSNESSEDFYLGLACFFSGNFNAFGYIRTF